MTTQAHSRTRLLYSSKPVKQNIYMFTADTSMHIKHPINRLSSVNKNGGIKDVKKDEKCNFQKTTKS
jgi:hypothetical protein